MRRNLARRAVLSAVVVLGSVMASVGAAPAAIVAPRSQDQLWSTWVQPGAAPLDGLGTFLYVAAPSPGAGQASTLGYEYTLLFRFQDGSGGVLALGYKNGQKVAGFGLVMTNHVVDTVPFDWKFGQIYYLLTYRQGANGWGAWVYDWSATSWSAISVQTAPAGTGGILPTSSTGVDYDRSLAPTAADPSTCSYYPRIDAFWYAPMGWRGTVITNATFGTNSVVKGDCPGTTTTENGWQHYGLGSAAGA